MKNKIKVLVVDDSALIRGILREIIDREEDMVCVGVAADPFIAKEMIKSFHPDVLTLDIEMPRMNGLVFLEKLMHSRPMPVLMVSTLTEKDSLNTLRALELGAVDFVSKPKVDVSRSIDASANEITEKIRTIAQAKIHPKYVQTTVPVISDRLVQKSFSADAILPSVFKHSSFGEKLIAIGASTGGTNAIQEILSVLPLETPGILIAQHMPENFTRSFAERLNTLCAITVKEAEQDEQVLPGHAYIAPGHSHLLLEKYGGHYVIRLDRGVPVNRHRPSVDVLFRSVANMVGENALGVILTGMGKDGALGLAEIRKAGGYTIAQDEESCIIFGMPKEAIAQGGVCEVVPLKGIPGCLVQRL